MSFFCIHETQKNDDIRTHRVLANYQGGKPGVLFKSEWIFKQSSDYIGLIYTNQQISVPFKFLEIQPHPSKEIESLLNANVIGTPGLSMLYQHLGVSQKLYHIAKPHVVSVRKNGTLIGTCCFCERNFSTAIGFYVRYFAFHQGFRLKALPPPRDQKKSSGMRAEIGELLNGKGLLHDTNKAFFHYAYVDPRNPRSARLCTEFGFIPIRNYTTRLFSRLWPKQYPHLNIKQLPATDEKIHSLLASFYRDYNHVSFENLNKIYYYIEDEAGEIIAGMQVNPDAWRVLTLPGRYSKALLNFFDRMPLLSRLLSKRFSFLAVDGIYYRAGKERIFEQLLDTLLYTHSLHTAIMVVDTESSLFQLTERINLGLLSRISPEVYGHVIASYHHADEAFITQQRSRPSYISVHDLS